MLKNQTNSLGDNDPLFVGDYKPHRLFSQTLLGWIKIPTTETNTLDGDDFYRCVQYYDVNIPDSEWNPYLQSRLQKIRRMKF